MILRRPSALNSDKHLRGGTMQVLSVTVRCVSQSSLPKKSGISSRLILSVILNRLELPKIKHTKCEGNSSLNSMSSTRAQN